MNFLLYKNMQFISFYRKASLFAALALVPYCLSAQTNLLTKKIDVQQLRGNLSTVVETLERATGISIIYSPSSFPSERKVNQNFQGKPLGDAIRTLFGEDVILEASGTNRITVRPSEGSGTIHGQAITSDGQPAGFVTITLGNKRIQADDNGQFVFTKVAAGKQHRLIADYVGVKKQVMYIVVKPNETKDISITMYENAQSLQEVVVNGERTNRFANKQTDYVARMPLAYLENPQSYSVVTKQLMQEQVSYTIADAIKNATGVVSVTNPSGGVSAYFRGFGVGINARNGMESTSERSAMDLANIERIEVLKGPSGTLFGSAVSSFGGIVNLVTKKPLEVKRTEVAYTNGSFGLNRLTVDLNSPLDSAKRVLFRVNGALHRERSFLDYGFNNTFLVAPSLSYRVNDRLSIQADAEILQVNNTQPMNSVIRSADIKQPSDIQLDRNTALYHDNVDVKNYATRMFAEVNYQLSENFKSTTLFSYVSENVERSYQRPVMWTSPTTAVRLSSVYGPVYNGYTNVQQNFNGHFYTGAVKHNILVGANFRNYSSNFLFADVQQIDQIDITNKFQPVTRQAIDAKMSFEPYPTPTQNTTSAYASDVIDLLPKLSAMVSLRLDRFSRAAIDDEDKSFKQTALAPKFGLVYQLVPQQFSLFGNYMSGFQNIAPILQPDGSRSVLAPIYANQAEGGVKAELLKKKITFTASYYYIKINNATRVDENMFTIQDGQQVSKGIDLEFISQPISGLNIVAGYAYNDNRIIKADPAAGIDGNKSANAPENVANFWASYTLQQRAKGLGVGFGVNYVDKMYRASNNVFFIPSYTLANATLFYNRQAWGIQVKANNIFNKIYWDNWGNVQAPASYAASLSFRF